MGLRLICSQSLHVGFCFAAFCFLLRYRQYPTTVPSGPGAGSLAFHERITLWWPVCGEACSGVTPAGGHGGSPTLLLAEINRSEGIVLCGGEAAPEGGRRNRRATMITKRVPTIIKSAPKTIRDCNLIPRGLEA